MFKCGSSSSSSAKGIGASDLASAPITSPGSTFIHPTDLTPHKPATTAGRRKGRLYSEDEDGQTSNSDGDSDDDDDDEDGDSDASIASWEMGGKKLSKKEKEKAKKEKEKAKKKKAKNKKKQPKQSDDDNDANGAASEKQQQQQKKKSEEDAPVFVSPALPIPSGTHPEDAWPDEEVRAKLVSTQSFASVATNRVSDMGLAPATYRIDLATDASEIAELQKEMNDGAIPALESAYQADNADVPRIHCKFPHPVFEYTADSVSHSFLNFELPLGDAATALDLHALQQQQESAENRGQVRMYLEPGSNEIACVPTATSQCVPSKNRTHHAVIISASARVTVNTTDSNFEIDLQVPNPARAKDRSAPLYVSCSEPIGITNNAGKCHMFAPLFANTQTPTTASPGLDNVHRIDPHVFNSPEARRWSSIDADEAIAAVSKDSHSAIQRHYTDDSGNEIIVIDLTSTPTNIAEFVAVTHAKELNAAAAAINAERTHASLQRTKRGKSGLPQLPIPAYAPYSVAVPSGGDALTSVVTPTLKPAVRVPLEAYARVVRHFCGLYNPSQFACNQQAMRLVLRPRGGEQQGMRSLYMNALRNKDKLAHVRIVLVVSQMPYEGRQELPKEARASFLADLQKDYADYMAIADEINTNTVNISRLTPRASAASGSSAGGAIVPRTSRAPSDGQWRTAATGKDAPTSVWDQPMVTTQPLMATSKSDLAFASAASATTAGVPARPIVDPRRYQQQPPPARK